MRQNKLIVLFFHGSHFNVPFWRIPNPLSGVVVFCFGDGFGPFAVAFCVVDCEGADGVAGVGGQAVFGAEGAGPVEFGFVMVVEDAGEFGGELEC